MSETPPPPSADPQDGEIQATAPAVAAAQPPAPPVLRAGRARRAAVEARRALILGSGLFDGDWYRRHHPPASRSDLDPLDHYLSHGVAARASPGPLFDAQAYLKQAWHLRPGLDDPLTHFLSDGMSERRRAVSVVDDDVSDAFDRPVEPLLSLPATSARPSIAVVVHVFYVELFDEICRALALLPYRVTLLVTTDEPEKAAAITQLFGAHGLDAHLLVRVGLNRGRNFAPFLLALRDTIRAHDLMLHLHTKKSLHGGAERIAWRQSLLRTLLPATSVINGLIERFAADPTLGVLTACPGDEMRYWGYHWLSNRHLAQPLFDRLGLKSPVPRGLFDYPAGGMFWARTKAISALLDHPWTADDFPPELGQTDGTLMHAIERIIVLMAAEAGFGFTELDYERGLCRPGWSSRNLDQYRRASHAGLLDTIDHVDTVSFDVFDTLLTRICLTPDAVPRYIGFMAARRFPGADDYVDRRRAAEAAARHDRSGEGDVDLDEIHARFSRDAGPHWTPQAIAFVQREEVELDLRTLRPRASMLEALRHASRSRRRVVLTSDSYLPRRLFDAMLDRFALRGLVDETYLSSERRARKDRGDLWTLLGTLERSRRDHPPAAPALADRDPPSAGAGSGDQPNPGIALDSDPAEPVLVLHVGDNEQSDIQRTADAGIRHFHIMSPTALFELRGLDLAPEGAERPPGPQGATRPAGPQNAERSLASDGAERPLGDEILLGPVACRLFNAPYLAPHNDDPVLLSQPEEAGAILFGPLLFAFVAWLARHPTTRHVDRLFFVAREGYFLKRLYDAVRVSGGRDDLPPSAYFHCSRRAALAAAQGRGFDPEPVLRGAGYHGSLAGFCLARLGFVPDPMLRHQHSEILLPRDNELVRCMLELMQPEIAAHGERALRAFTAYADTAGLVADGPHGFVDVGYSGTMQAAIQTALGRPLIGLYMGVSKAASQVRAGGGHAFGAFADGNVSSFTGGYGLMLEALLTAPHGQVIGYDDRLSPPAPLFRHDGMSQRLFPALERIYQGAEAYAVELMHCYGGDLLDLPFRPEAATAMLQSFRAGRIRLSPDLMDALSVEDDFCGNGEIAVFNRLAPPPPRRQRGKLA